jgi:hypothetical protein
MALPYKNDFSRWFAPGHSSIYRILYGYSVQNTTENGGGIQSFSQVGDSTYIYYSQAPYSQNSGDSITYKLNISAVTSEDTSGSGGIIIDTSTLACSPVKYGALFGLGSTALNMTALSNEGLQYARVSYNNTGSVSYPAYTSAGYKVLWSYNTAVPVIGSYTLLPTDTLSFRNKLDSILTANGTTNMEGAAVINELYNIRHGAGYWNPVSARNVINLLRAAVNVLHEHGIKAFDGGLNGEILYYQVWRDYVNRGFPDSAADFAARAFPAGTNLTNWATDTSHGYRISYADSIIAALVTLPTDAVNYHYYETVLNADSLNTTINPLTFMQIARYLRRATGKHVITNEFGLNNNTSTDILSQLIDAVEELHDEGNMEYAIWYSGNPDYSLVGDDASLTDLGVAFRDRVQDEHADLNL